MPSNVAVKFDINRQFGRYVPRIVNTFDNKVERVDSTYDKYFNFDRFYTFRYDPMRSLNIDFTAINRSRVDEPYGEISNSFARDSIRRNLYTGGRNVNYDQNVVFTYNVPTQKLPFLDWTQVRASYTARYRWAASSLLMQALNQGNILENGSDRLLNGELDFTKLYSKSRWLAALENEPAPKQKGTDSVNRTAKKTTREAKRSQQKTSKQALDSLNAKKLTKAERKLQRKQRREEKTARKTGTHL